MKGTMRPAKRARTTRRARERDAKRARERDEKARAELSRRHFHGGALRGPAPWLSRASSRLTPERYQRAPLAR